MLSLLFCWYCNSNISAMEFKLGITVELAYTRSEINQLINQSIALMTLTLIHGHSGWPEVKTNAEVELSQQLSKQ